MKLRPLAALATLAVSSPALAGGLFLPGSGATSTSRAGAAIASVEDGEAISLNPAGLAKTYGTTITVSAAFFQYFMEFSRRGTYDAISDDDQPYEGQPYPTMKNDARPPLGIGAMQPIPVVAIASDLGGAVPNLRVAAGLYAPSAYPFRDMTGGYVFNGDYAAPPPPTRYDVMKQEAAVFLPTIAASYRVLPELDVGARFSVGMASLKSTLALWGTPGNYEEAIKHDGLFNADVKDNFIPAFGFGVNYRPRPQLELAATFSSAVAIHGKGSATSENGPGVELNGNPITVGPTADEYARCAAGGTVAEQKVCIDLQLPMAATVGGRYLFLDRNGAMRGDLELNIGWENWGKRCDFVKDPDCTSPGTYRVVVDADIFVNGQSALTLKDSYVDHRLKDTFSVRLGGSYHIPLGEAPVNGRDNRNKVIVRAGLGADTRAAEDGWLRADLDGAGRQYGTIGGAFRTSKWELSVGGGYIHEGTNSNDGNCNPTATAPGCRGDGSENPPDDRSGPDPVNPILVPDQQTENPVNQGTIKSSYLMLMLGFSTWF
ncbi:MAG: OmpP1/FadL family transporter [Kofleriaceae bacterium]